MTRNRPITRRGFLGRTGTLAGAAIAAPYVVPASALGLGESPAPSERIVAAQIGVGMMGTGDVRAFMGFPEMQVIALCDVDQRRPNVNNVTNVPEANQHIRRDYREGWSL